MTNLHKVITNRRTGEKIVLAKPREKEIEIYDTSILITEIDRDGFITYVNRRYLELSGFAKETLIGAPYTIDRHPDMPEGLFAAREEIVVQKKVWRGYVKSMTRDGAYYWTLTYMQPKLDSRGQIKGYTLTRKKAYASSVEEIAKKYETLQGPEHVGNEFFMRGELYHGEDVACYA